MRPLVRILPFVLGCAGVALVVPSCEPPGGEWEAGRPAPLARFEANGTAAAGKLYVFGGYVNDALVTSARSDVYDPASDTWTRIADMPVPLTHAPTAESHDKIFLVGGFVGSAADPPTTTDVWRYRPSANEWLRAPRLPESRGGGAAAVVGRNLHFFGGIERVGTGAGEDRGDHWSLDLNDWSKGWVRRASMPVPRNHLAAVALGDDLYAIGGQRGSNMHDGNLADVHRYDTELDRWTEVASLPTGRGHIGSSAFAADGHVVVVAGTTNGGHTSTAVTAYDPDTDRWTALEPLPAGRRSPVAGVTDASVVVTGGYNEHPTASTWVAPLPLT